ncbi:MAG: hypothetical protein IT427_05740, partial [Pirellulales bacterium]|nr:hypothetical protein [Pirellulales bacterium]
AGPPLPIQIDQHFAMSADGTLQFLFEADAWNSTISFAPGIAVARGGVLALGFAPGVNIADQFGRTFDLFDWAGVSPTGAFSISSPYHWDLTELYTTGEVTLLAPGDFDADGDVDGADFVAWQTHFPTLSGATLADGDGDGDGDVDGADFVLWQTHFPFLSSQGAAPVPEPNAAGLALVAAVSLLGYRLRAAVGDRNGVKKQCLSR